MEKKLIKRERYLDKLIYYKDKDLIKVLTGIRRCGKTSLMLLMIEHLKETGIDPSQIIHINFEDRYYNKMTLDEFEEYVKERVVFNKRMYLFFDEVQRLVGFEDVINSFRVSINCDIYLTGSNSFLLSGEYATYLAGRYVEIKVLPLSFAEFIKFRGFRIKYSKEFKTYTVSKDGEIYPLNIMFDNYLKYGGIPVLNEIELNTTYFYDILDGIFNSIITRDIIEYNVRRNHKIIDGSLLIKITNYLAETSGNLVSLNNIKNVLVNEGLLLDRTNTPAVSKIGHYVDNLCKTYLFTEVLRYDIKGKERLKTLSKFYITDIGFRNLLIVFNNTDKGRVLENIVYLELIRRGYKVFVGKIGELEVDFVCFKNNEISYYQVTLNIDEEKTFKREVRSLKAIDDNYPKYIITNEHVSIDNYEGIKILNIQEWLIDNGNSDEEILKR